MHKTQQQEVDDNYREFVKLLPSIIVQHGNKCALMKDGEIKGYFSTFEDASMAGSQFIEDGIFSVQQVSNIAIDLGFFNYAIPVDQL